MSDAQPDLSHTAELSGGRRLHEHVCQIHDSHEEQLAAALPYLRGGLERREKCLYIGDADSGAAVLDALRKGGIDVDHYVRSRSLIIAGKQETIVKHGRCDPDWWIRFLSEATTEAGNGSFSGLRALLGEMSWALGDDVGPPTLIELEAKLNHFVRDHDVGVVCQYNRNRLSPELVLGVIHTHPVVVYGGIIRNNPYYVPPDEFLKPNHAPPEVERLLNNMLTWEHSLAQLRDLAARMETVREDERTRAAREIHDGLGQALTAIKLEFTALLRDLQADEGPVGQRSHSILQLLDETFQSIRRIATELRPGILDDLGLPAAVEWTAKEFEARTGTKVQISLPDGDLAMDSERATALFRIFQETLTNVARHAKATHVRVQLTAGDGMLTLEVHDNGQGIAAKQLPASSSLGMQGMRERALLVGGELIISGAPGCGTTVSVRIPEAPSQRSRNARDLARESLLLNLQRQVPFHSTR